jgi:arsenate reductase-like glutaredoxin family protein
LASHDTSAVDLSNSLEVKIVVYTSNGCNKCSVLKEWLKAAKRHFEERSLENMDVMTELVMRDIVVLSAPVLEVENSVYSETEFFEGNALAVNKLQEILEGNGNGRR